MIGLLHAMAFMVLLLVGWVIRNNKPLPWRYKRKKNNHRFKRFGEHLLAGMSLKLTAIYKYSEKAVAGFAVNAWGPFVYFLQPESRKWLFGKLHLCPSI